MYYSAVSGAIVEDFVIYSDNKVAGYITVKIITEIVKEKTFTYIETITTSTVNRWFPGREVITIDKEYLDENYRPVWFDSEIFYKDKKIRLFGKAEGDVLHLTRYDNTRKINTKTIYLGDSCYTSGALRFLYRIAGLTNDKTFKLHILDKKHFKWRKIKLKICDQKTIDLDGKVIEVYPIEVKHSFLLSNITYIDKGGNVLYSKNKDVEIKRVK